MKIIRNWTKDGVRYLLKNPLSQPTQPALVKEMAKLTSKEMKEGGESPCFYYLLIKGLGGLAVWT